MKLGPYDVLAEIGRGGMGVVFRARAPDGRDVAIKILYQTGTEGALERFDRERRITGELGAGFVPVIDSGASPRGHFLVMPFVPGGTLRERLRHGPLGVGATVELGRALASALARAHERGIVHRDLKPENCIFTAEGVPLVADLGLAKHFAAESGAGTSASLSKTATMRGTLGYMPPEQMADAKHVGPAADVFALGAILHECLAGTPAFEGENAIELLRRVDSGARSPLVVSGAPAWLTSAIDRALATDPAQRFADAGELARALAPSPPRRRGALVAGILALGVVVAIAVARREPRTERREGRAESIAPPITGVSVVASSLPTICRSFTRTKTFVLTRVFGSYLFRNGMTYYAFALSPDRRLALVGSDEMAILWDAATGEEIASLGEHGAPVTAVAFSRDGRLAATGTQYPDGSGPFEPPPVEGPALRVFSVPDGKLVRRIDLGDANVGSLAFGPGSEVFVMRPDGATVACDVSSGTTRPVEPPALARAFSKDGARCALTLPKGIELLGEGERTIETGVLGAVAYSSDLTKALVGERNGEVSLWSLDAGRKIFSLGKHEGAVTGVAFSPDEKGAASTGEDSRVRIWDMERAARGEDAARSDIARGGRPPRFRPRAVGWASSERVLVTGWDGAVRLLGVSGAVPLPGFEGHTQAVISVAVSADGKTLFSGSRDMTLRFWDAASGALSVTGYRDANEVWSVLPLADGKSLATAGGSIHTWDLATHAVRQSTGSPEATISLGISPDGKQLLSGTVGGRVSLRDAASGAEVAGPWSGLPPWSFHVSFVRGGWLGGIEGGGLAVRDLSSGEVLRPLSSGGRRITDAVATPDGRRVVGTTVEGGVLLWDLSAGGNAPVVCRPLGSGSRTASALAVAADGRRAACATYDRRIRVFDLEAETLVDEIDLGSAPDVAVSLAFAGASGALYAGTARGVVLRFDPR